MSAPRHNVTSSVLLLAWVSRKANRQMKRAMEAQDTVLTEQQRSLEMQAEGLRLIREGNRLLAEILEELRRQPGP